jgi:hypothetical protein
LAGCISAPAPAWPSNICSRGNVPRAGADRRPERQAAETVAHRQSSTHPAHPAMSSQGATTGPIARLKAPSGPRGSSADPILQDRVSAQPTFTKAPTRRGLRQDSGPDTRSDPTLFKPVGSRLACRAEVLTKAGARTVPTHHWNSSSVVMRFSPGVLSAR